MQPNILLLVNDHQAYYRHRWAGAVRPQTPCFDRLALSGVRFNRAYTPAGLCVPARRSLWSGLLPHHHGLTSNDESEQPAPSAGLLFPHLIGARYRCSYFGKWHNGPLRLQEHGCDGFSIEGYGNPYTTPEYQAYRDHHRLDTRCVIRHAFHEASPKTGCELALEQVGTSSSAYGEILGDERAHEAWFLAHLACRRLKELQGPTPWFMAVNFWGPHRPYLPARRFLDRYQRELIEPYGSLAADLSQKPRGYRFEHNYGVHDGNDTLLQPSPRSLAEWQDDVVHCYAHISMIDEAGGRILEALERYGMHGNTLVLWTTDHGDAIGSHGGHITKGPYMSEEIYRVPLAARWPGRFPAGRHCDDLVGLCDLAPTILAAAGTTFEGPRDGVSLLGIMSGRESARRSAMVSEFGGLFHRNHHAHARALVSARHRYVDTLGDTDELYDLDEDPYQLTNLAHSTEHAGLRGERRAALLVELERTGDPYARHLGHGG